MPRDSQGQYSLPSGTLVAGGQTIQISQHNPFASDVAAALSQSLSRTGAGSMQADLNMSGYAVTGGRIDAVTPNEGSKGGVRIRANGTSAVAYLQFTSPDGNTEYGNWRVGSNGIANWSGGGLQVGGQSVWHTGNFNPDNYARSNRGQFETQYFGGPTNSSGYTYIRANSGSPESHVEFRGMADTRSGEIAVNSDGSYLSLRVGNDAVDRVVARRTGDLDLSATDNLKFNGNTVYHSGNFNTSDLVRKSGTTFDGLLQANAGFRVNGGGATFVGQVNADGLNVSGALTKSGSPVAYNSTRPSAVITDGTGQPSGGSDGDMYFQYS